MLTQGIIQQNAQNRRCERAKIWIKQITEHIDIANYESFIKWLFQVHIFQRDGEVISFLSIFPFIQTSDQLHLLEPTKYLARTYFDLCFWRDQNLAKHDCLLVMIAALCLAIKFNEIRAVSDQLTPEFFISRLNINITIDEYLCTETNLMRILNFKFKYTTPYDYIDIFMAKFPFFPKMNDIFPVIIKLALTHHISCEYNAEEIFFGSVLTLLEKSNAFLDNFQQNILKRLTDSWPRAKIMGVILLQNINQAQPTSNTTDSN